MGTAWRAVKIAWGASCAFLLIKALNALYNVLEFLWYYGTPDCWYWAVVSFWFAMGIVLCLLQIKIKRVEVWVVIHFGLTVLGFIVSLPIFAFGTHFDLLP